VLAAFTLTTLNEAEALAEQLAATLPDPMRRVAGILELLLNAIEHGNLEVTSVEKQELLRSGRWQDELRRRLGQSPWRERVVRVSTVRTASEWVLTVVDEGAGFAHGQTPSSEPTQFHGRGLSMARYSFDSVAWEGRGNVVVARVVLS